MSYHWDHGATASPGEQTELILRLKQQMVEIMGRGTPAADPAPPPEELPAPPVPDHLRSTVDADGLIYRHVSAAHEDLGVASLARPDRASMGQVEALLEMEHGWPDMQCALLRAEQLLFLDIETTGLGEEEGPLAFTVGLGSWPRQGGGRFHVDQIFLQDPEQEHRALELLAAHVERCRVLVTFNGRAFDWPVLQERALLHAVPLDLGGRCHMDLLAPSRRLFRPRMMDCKQQTLERALLGFNRRRDVDGAGAPGIYRRYLRSGQRDEITGVLEHNRLDVTCMAPLLLTLAAHAEDPLVWAEDAEELLAAGLMKLRSGLHIAGRRCLERGLELARIPATRRRLLEALAREERRAGRHDRARVLWERHVDQFPMFNAGWVELAKYHEHVSKDLRAALAHAQKAPRHSPDVLHRMERLQRRLEKAEGA